MMGLLGRFRDLAEQALAAGVAPERLAALPVFRALQRMGEDIGEEDIERFAALQAQLEQVLGELIHAGREAPDAAATVD